MRGCNVNPVMAVTSAGYLFLWVFIKLPLSKKIWMEFRKGGKRVLEIIQLKITVIITQTSVCWICLYCTFDTETSLSVV